MLKYRHIFPPISVSNVINLKMYLQRIHRIVCSVYQISLFFISYTLEGRSAWDAYSIHALTSEYLLLNS